MATSDYINANKILKIIYQARGSYPSLKDRIDTMETNINIINSNGTGLGITGQKDIIDVIGSINFPYTIDIDIEETINFKLPPIEVLKNVNGNWSVAIKGTDYSYSYINNTTLRISFFSNGDFKVNY